MSAICNNDIEYALHAQVSEFSANRVPVNICGGGSKWFYGESMEAHPFEVGSHTGVVDYDPAEMVITLRAGCRLCDVNALLAEHGQMFAFDPPDFACKSTIGGMIASGLAGPSRSDAGGVRDFVLGVKMIDGHGQILSFGGRVIKNVAGFDLSRVMVGAMGTLGIILEASIKVVPLFETELTLSFEHRNADDHIRWVNDIASSPYPLTASLWRQGISVIRLSGSEQGVAHSAKQLGGEVYEMDWRQYNNPVFSTVNTCNAITRVSVPPTTADILGDNNQVIEWSGAQRWLFGKVNISNLRDLVENHCGTVCAYRNHLHGTAVFHPLPSAILALQKRLKSSFDPGGVFNPGRLYPEL